MKLDPETYGWPSFRNGQHILGLLNFDGEAPWLPDEIVDELKQRCESLNEIGGIWRRYQPGEWVQVVNSTLQGLGQVVEDGKTSQAPVRVLLRLFERLVPVQVSRSNLQPMENMSLGAVGDGFRDSVLRRCQPGNHAQRRNQRTRFVVATAPSASITVKFNPPVRGGMAEHFLSVLNRLRTSILRPEIAFPTSERCCLEACKEYGIDRPGC